MCKEMIKKYFGTLMLLFFLSACGSAEKNNVQNLDQTNSNSAPQTENPLSPGNLPPPASSSTNSSLSVSQQNSFFERKQVWDSFSPQLKQKIMESYSGNSGKRGEVFNTLMGKIIVEDKTEIVVLDGKVSGQSADKPGTMSAILADTASLPANDPCLTGASFLCISSPHEGIGVVEDILHVQGALKMSDVAFFTATDPVGMVSVFKQPASGPLQTIIESLITPNDINSVNYQASPTADPIEVGLFQKEAPLSGAGIYQVLVSVWKNTETGVQLEVKRFAIYRQSIPKFVQDQDGVKVYPANRLANTCDKEHPVIIGASAINVNVSDVCIETKLQDEGTPNVGVIVEDYARDANNNLVMIYAGSGKLLARTTDSVTNQPIITTLVPLYAGFNHFKVKVQNTLLSSTPIPNEAQKEFELVNGFSGPSLKFSESSVVDGKVMEITSTSTSAPLQFCITSDGTNCITDVVEASKPEIIFNNISISADQISLGSSGQFSLNLHPFVGVNTFSVKAPRESTAPFPEYKASFAYGKVNKLYENGQLKEQDNFLKRGLSLEINKNVFSNQLKHVLENFLNKPDFKHTFVNFLKKDTSSTPRPACSAIPGSSPDSGDSTINFLEDTLQLGSFELLEFTPTSQNTLRVALRLKNFKGDLDLRPLIPGRTTPQADDYNFIALSLDIGELDIAIDIAFEKNTAGAYLLAIKEIAGRPIINVIPGADAAGRFIFVNSHRNPFNPDLQAIYGPGNALGGIFINSIKETLLCGVAHNLNNNQTGLSHWFADLPKLINYNNQNTFRAPLQFEMLGKQVGIDIAYDVLHAQEISFSDRGLKIVNVPLRFSPGPIVLAGVPDAIKNSLVGSISSPDLTPEPSAASPDTTESQNLTLSLSEEAINQAFFAANFAGMLDIAIDPNFFTNNEIPFLELATPTVKDMIGMSTGSFFDLNQNGIDDDADLPLQLKLTTNKLLAPNLHFMSADEINSWATQLEVSVNANQTAENRITINRDLKYFKFTLPDFEIGIYRVVPIPESYGGVKAFCSNQQPQKVYPSASDPADPSMLVPAVKITSSTPPNHQIQACSQTLSVDYDIPLNGSCAEPTFKKVVVPAKNGYIISALPNQANVPLIKFKSSLTLYGAFEGSYRGATVSERFTVANNLNAPPTINDVPNPASKNFLRIKIIPAELKGVNMDLQVVENHLPVSEGEFLEKNKIRQILSVAVGTDCLKFNEIKIPVPDKFVDDPAVEGDFMEKLKDFGINSIDLGSSESTLPQVSTDASALYLDLTAHLGLGYLMTLNPQVAADIAIQEILRQRNAGQH